MRKLYTPLLTGEKARLEREFVIDLGKQVRLQACRKGVGTYTGVSPVEVIERVHDWALG